MTTPIDPQRLAVIDAITLDRFDHRGPSDGACVMEAVAFVAGERWSDRPKCVSPVLGALCRAWNDVIDDDTRQELKPYIPRLAGSRGTRDQEEHRARIARAWLQRTAPALPRGRRGRGAIAHAVRNATATYGLRIDGAPANGRRLRRRRIHPRAALALRELIELLLAVTEHPHTGPNPAAGDAPDAPTATAPAAFGPPEPAVADPRPPARPRLRRPRPSTSGAPRGTARRLPGPRMVGER